MDMALVFLRQYIRIIKSRKIIIMMKITFGDYLIRNWKENDVDSIIKYANNQKISMNLRDGFPHPYTLSDAKAFLSMIDKQDPNTFYAIASREEVIGSIGLVLGTDVHRFSAEMGYWLAESFWNKGIITNAVKKITEFAFTTFNLNRISAAPYSYNKASIKVLEKTGFKFEGIMRANVFKGGKILDQYLYAKIKKGI